MAASSDNATEKGGFRVWLNKRLPVDEFVASQLTGYFAPTSGTLAVLGETFGRSDWRELRRRIGLVGPSVAAMIQPAEPALAVVAGGSTDSSTSGDARSPPRSRSRVGCSVCSRSAASPRVRGATSRRANASACSSPAPWLPTPRC